MLAGLQRATACLPVTTAKCGGRVGGQRHNSGCTTLAWSKWYLRHQNILLDRFNIWWQNLADLIHALYKLSGWACSSATFSSKDWACMLQEINLGQGYCSGTMKADHIVQTDHPVTTHWQGLSIANQYFTFATLSTPCKLPEDVCNIVWPAFCSREEVARVLIPYFSCRRNYRWYQSQPCHM